MKKGFTLIELLAVIVILGIISLIAMPRIINIIEKSRISSKESSAKGYIKSINDQIVSNEFNEDTIIIKDGIYYTVLLEEIYKLKVAGEKPTDNSWVKIDDGKVKEYSLRFDGYVVDSTESTTKGNVRDMSEDACVLMTPKRKGTYTTGDSWGCDLGNRVIRRFYYLSQDQNTITLILDKNLENSVNYLNKNSRVSSLTENWNITGSIPTLEQISKNDVIYSFITKDLNTNTFWTSTGIVNSEGHTEINSGSAGIRPIITINKTL